MYERMKILSALMHKSSKRLNLVSIWSFDEFFSYTWDFLNIKPISYLTMVCYHQNPIRRTLGLTIIFDILWLWAIWLDHHHASSVLSLA